MKTYVIGSMSCADKIREVAKYLEEAGCDVEYVKPQPEKDLSDLILECYKHIFEADEIVAVSKADGSYGTGTMYEIGFAQFLDKKVYKWREDQCDITI